MEIIAPVETWQEMKNGNILTFKNQLQQYLQLARELLAKHVGFVSSTIYGQKSHDTFPICWFGFSE